MHAFPTEREAASRPRAERRGRREAGLPRGLSMIGCGALGVGLLALAICGCTQRAAAVSELRPNLQRAQQLRTDLESREWE